MRGDLSDFAGGQEIGSGHRHWVECRAFRQRLRASSQIALIAPWAARISRLLPKDHDASLATNFACHLQRIV